MIIQTPEATPEAHGEARGQHSWGRGRGPGDADRPDQVTPLMCVMCQNGDTKQQK